MASGSLHGLLFHTKVTRIEPQLLLGDMMDAQNKTLLLKLGVTHILNMAGETQCYHPNTFTYKQIPASDHEEFDLFRYFHECADFISIGQRSGGSVLVHCAYGVSRGSSAVISFLIKYRKNTYQEALSKVQAKRTNASPNLGFAKQLRRFQTELGVKPAESKTLRLIQIEEETEPQYLEEDMNKVAKLSPNLPKGAFRSVQPISNRDSTNMSPANKSVRGLVGIRNSVQQAATLKTLTASQQRAQQRRDEELAEFRKYVGLQGLSFLSRPQDRLLPSPPKLSPVPRAKDVNKTSPKEQKVLAGYSCIQCTRILADPASLSMHGKNPVKRCSVVFLNDRPQWFVGDSLGGVRRIVNCPNPRCKTAVGEICEQGITCSCGFADNPGYTLSLDKATPFYRPLPEQEPSKSR